MTKYDFSSQNRYNTGSYKYDRIKNLYPNANNDSIIMTVADMDFKTSPEVINYLKNVCDAGIFGYMTEYYTPYFKAINKWFNENFNLNINEDEIIFSNGTIEALKVIINLYSNEGDYICLSRPVYGHFTYSIENECKRKVKDIHLINHNNHYEMDFVSLKKELSDEKCKIYVLCSPHNPIGRVWKEEELIKLVEICQQTNTLLVSDEVHCDFVRSNYKHIPVLKLNTSHANIIMLTSIGKTFNMSGLQCSNMIIKDKKIYNNIRNNFDRDISTFALNGLIAAYNYGKKWKDALNNYIDDTINEAIKYIKENMPYCDVTYPEGTYFLYLDFNKSNLSNEKIHDIIYNKANVFLQDGVEHDPLYGKGYQRMVVAYSKDKVMLALKRISEAFKEVIK